ncbi:hypothetical protein BC941DRAFT_433639 [Chlamydoabsidia padenii]|nr:hypothetical protein BC941DRAFT_433639 [Chlamydoabsidia padenii]
MRSEQFSSISSLPLEPTDDPLSSSPTEQITSRPHPPSTTIVHSSDHTVATCPIGEGEGTNTDYITATTSNQHTNLSPNLTTTQIPVTPTSSASSSPTTMTDELAKLNNMTPSQKLDMELGDLSFPHDDDRFSIHSDYQPSIHLRDTSSPHNNQTWKKRSIKKMLSRSSHHNVK